MTKKPVKATDALWGAVKNLETAFKHQFNQLSISMHGEVEHLETRLGTADYERKQLRADIGNQYDAVKNLEKRMDMFGSGAAINEAVRAPLQAMSSGQFCVIGDKATCQYPISRTWKTKKMDAVSYAQSLVRNNSSTEELYVVQVVAVVRRRQPELEVINY